MTREGPGATKVIVPGPALVYAGRRLVVSEGALSEAFEASYSELRRLARQQLRRLRPGHTPTANAVVHESNPRRGG